MSVSERQEIIMNFGAAPSLDDVLMIAQSILASVPDELTDFIEDLELDIQDFPDEVASMDQNLEDPYDLVALYQSAKEVTPGVEKKNAEGCDTLILYRRPILDYWCESGEQLELVLRQIMIEEIASKQDFSEDEIEEMINCHHQGIL